MSNQDRTGWYEFIKPGAATTHIGYAQENGSVYLPEGPEVVTEEDFRLASATDRFWRLVREPRTISTDAELDALPVGSVIRTSGLDFHSEPRVARKDGVWKNESEWFVADGSEWCLSSDELDDLPATVLYEPGATK